MELLFIIVLANKKFRTKVSQGAYKQGSILYFSRTRMHQRPIQRWRWSTTTEPGTRTRTWASVASGPTSWRLRWPPETPPRTVMTPRPTARKLNIWWEKISQQCLSFDSHSFHKVFLSFFIWLIARLNWLQLLRFSHVLDLEKAN